MSIVYSYDVSRLRILKSQLRNNAIRLQCPLTGSPQQSNQLISTKNIIWIDEINQDSKQDRDIMILNNIMLAQSTLVYNLNQQINDLSCGYYIQSYKRIKKWKLTYVDKAEVTLNTKINNRYLEIKRFNDTYAPLVLKQSLGGQTLSGDIMQLACSTNFDAPLTTAIIWLNYIRYDENNRIIVSFLGGLFLLGKSLLLTLISIGK